MLGVWRNGGILNRQHYATVTVGNSIHLNVLPAKGQGIHRVVELLVWVVPL
jgi:hypothetical protein